MFGCAGCTSTQKPFKMSVSGLLHILSNSHFSLFSILGINIFKTFTPDGLYYGTYLLLLCSHPEHVCVTEQPTIISRKVCNISLHACFFEFEFHLHLSLVGRYVLTDKLATWYGKASQGKSKVISDSFTFFLLFLHLCLIITLHFNNIDFILQKNKWLTTMLWMTLY